MKQTLSSLLVAFYAVAMVMVTLASADVLVSHQNYYNPSHESLKANLRAGLDPARADAMEDAVEDAFLHTDSRLVRKILGEGYADLGARARVHSFNRLMRNSTEKFVPWLASLLKVEPRHEPDLRDAAFGAGQRRGVWHLHKLAYAPRRSPDGGTRLSCLLVHVTEDVGNFDVVVVVSATAEATIGDADLLVLETKSMEQAGLADEREGRLTRTGGEVALTEGDLTALMTFAELNCLRKLGSHFHLAYDG